MGPVGSASVCPLPPLAVRALAILVAVKLGLHLASIEEYGIFRDELYYIACSEHLALGYVDHPPLSILILWIVRQVLGDSLTAIRLLPVLAGGATVVVTALLAREFGGGRRAQTLAALAAVAAPFLFAIDHLFSMNAFDALFWALLFWIAARALLRDDPRLWLPFGVLAGIGLLNKYSVALLGFGLVLGLLTGRGRRHLASPWMWAGGLAAAVLFAPHGVWQASEGWPSLEFMARAQAEKIRGVGVMEFLWGQLLLLHPLNAPIWIAGLVALLRAPRLAAVRPLGWAWLVLLVFFLTRNAKVYYLAPAYPPLLAAGAWTVERWLGERGRRPAFAALVTILALGGAAALPLALPMLPVPARLRYGRALGIEPPRSEHSHVGELPQIHADMHGWNELVDTVERVYERLDEVDRRTVVVLTRNYGEAGAIDFIGRKRGLPPAISGHNSYWLWGPGRYTGDVLIVLGRTRDELSGWFESVERVDTVRCQYCLPAQNDLPVWVCRGLRVPIEEAWAQLRDFI